MKDLDGTQVKTPKSKAEIRAALEREMAHFEKGGGHVTQVPRGISGKDALEPVNPQTRRLFLEPSSKRTLVPEVVAAIESRRKQKLKRTPAPKTSRLPKPRRKTIYDDFGEPLRRVWVEE